MDETTQSKVEKIFQKFEDNVNEGKRNVEQSRQEIERFQEEYIRVKREVIKPTMEEVGTYVKQSGHDYRINESEKEEREIGMAIIPKTGKINLDEPSISFKGWAPDIKISKRPLHNSNPSTQSVKIEDITKSFVEQNILDVMEQWVRLKEDQHKKYG